MTDLAGSICIRCGFEPLQSEEAEWWCPECWNSGTIVTRKPGDYPHDALLHACRQIVDTQRAQLRAIRRGEKLGEASILTNTLLAEHFALPTEVIEERDDAAPWERPDPDYYTKLFAEWDEELGRGVKGSWVSRRHPELSWLDHLADKSFYRLPETLMTLRKHFPWISEVEWRVLLA